MNETINFPVDEITSAFLEQVLSDVSTAWNVPLSFAQTDVVLMF